MKNNIILIIVVTLISIAVIIISIAVSTGGKGGESSQTVGQQTSETSQDTEPSVPDTSSEPVTLPEQTTTQAQSSEPEPDETDEQTIGDIISLAGSLIGTDFADGGESPSTGFDNSGYIYYVLRENGYITCPRGVAAQSQMGTSLEYAELSRGDLVFFSESGTQAEFGGIYIGDGKMLACLMPGSPISSSLLTYLKPEIEFAANCWLIA